MIPSLVTRQLRARELGDRRHRALQGSDRLKGLKTWRDFQREPPEPEFLIHPKSVLPLGDGRRDGRPVSQGDSA